MFQKDIKIGSVGTAAAVALVFVTMPAFAMTAYSITHQKMVTENGKKFWQIRATCTDLRTKRYIVRSDDKAPWCAKQFPDFCANSKVQAAVNICSSDYARLTDSEESSDLEYEEILVESVNKQGSIEAFLLQEQALIKTQRVKLAKRKQALERKEIRLRKREFDLLDRIENLP